jgi:hypothetical protein
MEDKYSLSLIVLPLHVSGAFLIETDLDYDASIFAYPFSHLTAQITIRPFEFSADTPTRPH